MGLIEIVLLVFVLLLLFGALPVYPYSRTWGCWEKGEIR